VHNKQLYPLINIHLLFNHNKKKSLKPESFEIFDVNVFKSDDFPDPTVPITIIRSPLRISRLISIFFYNNINNKKKTR
jgi:hypothetical protein